MMPVVSPSIRVFVIWFSLIYMLLCHDWSNRNSGCLNWTYSAVQFPDIFFAISHASPFDGFLSCLGHGLLKSWLPMTIVFYMRLDSVDPVPLDVVYGAQFTHAKNAESSTKEHIFNILLRENFAFSLIMAFPTFPLTGL